MTIFKMLFFPQCDIEHLALYSTEIEKKETLNTLQPSCSFWYSESKKEVIACPYSFFYFYTKCLSNVYTCKLCFFVHDAR